MGSGSAAVTRVLAAGRGLAGPPVQRPRTSPGPPASAGPATSHRPDLARSPAPPREQLRQPPVQVKPQLVQIGDRREIKPRRADPVPGSCCLSMNNAEKHSCGRFSPAGRAPKSIRATGTRAAFATPASAAGTSASGSSRTRSHSPGGSRTQHRAARYRNNSDLPLPPNPCRYSTRRGDGSSLISATNRAMTSNRSKNNSSDRSCATAPSPPPVSSKIDICIPTALTDLQQSALPTGWTVPRPNEGDRRTAARRPGSWTLSRNWGACTSA
jgi:hypothetical protein